MVAVLTLGHSCFQFVIGQLMFWETELFAVSELFYSKETDTWDISGFAIKLQYGLGTG